MGAIENKLLAQDEKDDGYTAKTYPALLLGQMGVDEPYRNNGIGKLITEYCVGLAMELAPRIASRFVILQTDKLHSEYYERKCEFKTQQKSKEGRRWLYRRVA
jgi:predicted N-acetyltransferase YhbS